MNKTAQVDISFVNPANPGKKMGSIKTRDNITYWVYADKLHLFRPGPCVIEYDDSPGKDGKPFLKAQGVVNGNGHAMPPSDNLGAKQWPAQSTQAPAEQPANMSRNEHIFVCGALNSAIKNGQLTWNDANLVTAINAFRMAYAATFGADDRAA